MDSSVNPDTFMAAGESMSNQNSFPFSNALNALTNSPQQGIKNTAINIGYDMLSCSDDTSFQQQSTSEPTLSQSQPDMGFDFLSNLSQQCAAKSPPCQLQPDNELGLLAAANLCQQQSTTEPGLSEDLDSNSFPQASSSQQPPTTKPVLSQSQPDTDPNSLSFPQASSYRQQPIAEPIPCPSQQDTWLDIFSYPQAGLSQQPFTSELGLSQSQSGTDPDFFSFLQDNLFEQQPTGEPAPSQPQSGTGLGFWPFSEDNVLRQQPTGEPVLPQSQPNTDLDFLSFPEGSLPQKQSTSEPTLLQTQPSAIDPAGFNPTNQNEIKSFDFFDMPPPPDLFDYRILPHNGQLETRKPKLNLLLQPTFTRPDDMANVVPAFSFGQTAPIFGEFKMPEPTFTMQTKQAAHSNNSNSFQDLASNDRKPETQTPPSSQSVELNSSHRRPRKGPFSRSAPPEVADEDILDAMRAAPRQRDGDRVEQGRVTKKQVKRGAKRSGNKSSRWDSPLAVPKL